MASLMTEAAGVSRRTATPRRQTEDVAIDHGHARQPPVLGRFTEGLVDGGGVGHGMS